MASDNARILSLSNELLREILDHIDADTDKQVTVDRRAYLSQESFKPPPSPEPKRAQDIAAFRLTCKRFADLGGVCQFARVTTRFSRQGFDRLESIAGRPHLARHVRKFSYMVPYFYVDGRNGNQQLQPFLLQRLGVLDGCDFVRKINEQREIVSSGEDERALKRALAAFTSLQHVQILRVQDQTTAALLAYVRHHAEDLDQLVELRWAPACSHSARTLGIALLESRSPCSRFSSPMLSPQSAIILASHPPKAFAALAERLTCLELHFDDGNDLDNKMRELSGLFRLVFTAAKNMQAVHVGFPSHRPLSLRLEEVFHHIRWDRLLAFGIQAWRLDAQEIVALARRHRDRLKGLRLRDVLLKDGSMWRDVLAALRDDMVRLDWVSLRRIGYTKHFDEQWAVAGAEVPDDPPGGASESDEEGDWNAHPATEQDDSGNALDADISDSASDYDRSEDDNGPDEEGMDFPMISPDTPSSVPWCNCERDSFLESPEALADNGLFVSNAQRRIWEKWVVRRCPEHSES